MLIIHFHFLLMKIIKYEKIDEMKGQNERSKMTLHIGQSVEFKRINIFINLIKIFIKEKQ